MKRRPLGATGITVGEIGLGAWQLASTDWGVYDRAEALRVVQQALDAGCDFFDTAPPYGGGRSETLLGRALAEVRPSVTICTKFGHSAAFPPTNFDVAALRPSLEASLRRLRTDYVDVLLLLFQASPHRLPQAQPIPLRVGRTPAMLRVCQRRPAYHVRCS